MRRCGECHRSSVLVAAIATSITLLASATAQAGIDAWTTTGPVAGWRTVVSDTSALGAIRLVGPERVAVSDDLGSSWNVQPPESVFGNPLSRIYVSDDGSTHDYDGVQCQDPATPGSIYFGQYGFSRSDDGGRTWSSPIGQSADVFGPHTFWDIACSGAWVFAINNGSLLRSSQVGAGLDSIPRPNPDGKVGAIAFDGQTLYAVGGGNPRRVFASLDHGATWRPNPYVFYPGAVIPSLVAAEGQRLVALVQEGAGGLAPVSFVPWISTDGGVSFAPRSDGAFVASPLTRLRVDALRRNRLLAVGPGVLRFSFDGGDHWQIPLGLPDGATILDANWATPPTAGGAVLVVTTAEFGVLVSEDGGTSFHVRNRALPGMRVGQVLALDHADERVELAGGLSDRYSSTFTETGALQRRAANGNRWVRGESLGPIAVAPLEPQVLLTSAGRRSDDGGATWSASDLPYAFRFTTVPGVGPSPLKWSWVTVVNSLSAIAGYVRRGDPMAQAWTGLPSLQVDQPLLDVQAAAIAPSDPDIVYVAMPRPPTFPGGVAVPPYLGRSLDGGATFTARTLPPAPPPATPQSQIAMVRELWVDPANASRLLATMTTGNVVYESQDGAGVWTALPAIAGATRAYTVTVEPGPGPRRLYAGTDDGVYLMVGDAAGWTRIGGANGMHVAQVKVEGPAERRTLTAATDRGVFELTLDSAAATLPVYRFYNTQTRTHFYTASQAERDHVVATWPHFIPEGVAFHAVKADRTTIGNPVWRFFNTQTGTHFYTSSPAERAHVLATWPQFVEEGVVYRALVATEPGTVKLFRFFNTETGAHFTTTEDDERDYVNSRLPMFVDEGPTYSVYPAAPQ